MASSEATIKETAKSISQCLTNNAPNEAIRLAFRIHEHYQRSSVEARLEMIKEQPDDTGDPRFDALMLELWSIHVRSIGLQPLAGCKKKSIFLTHFGLFPVSNRYTLTP